ncbi:MAG: hypothetical protein HY699_08670 [Deltaproteobacteria bacterium]|nr:hypothetical protein [Deltaproteobacteria bacterium]
MSRPIHLALALALIVSLSRAGSIPAAELPAALTAELDQATYVYIASQRKTGGFGKPAEIWFLHHAGALWVGTPPTTWRVKRIKAGRTAARIAIGKSDGPAFQAVGSLVNDPEVQNLMLQTYAKKYPDRWPAYEQKFRSGFKDGSRVLVKYTPQ